VDPHQRDQGFAAPRLSRALDSISSAANDDGSGTVSIMEIAEAFAKGSAKPKRSLIFIWQMGEEKGLWGSEWFTNHPTVPRDSIIADLNLDMVGRGAATDVTGKNKEGQELFGAENYVQLVGSRRLSTELGDIVEQVNGTEKMPFKFDYSMDANGHPQNIYSVAITRTTRDLVFQSSSLPPVAMRTTTR
jgi:Zn-dependent M28 family amino/carboxypeptidase